MSDAAPPAAPVPAVSFDPSTERPRRSADRYGFEFWSPRASIAGHVTMWRWPEERIAWYSTAVYRPGLPVVALCDEFPLKSTLELRGNGLWADLNLEDPFVHWSMGLEAFALALDHPADDRGERVPLGYDLDWECDAAVLGAVDDGYEQPARVRGEVLVGADAYELDGLGWRCHVGAGIEPEGARRRHGLLAGTPVWSALDDVVRPGDDVAAWSQSITPAGVLRQAPYRDESGAVGFTVQRTAR